jgi:hypothetical protein
LSKTDRYFFPIAAAAAAAALRAMGAERKTSWFRVNPVVRNM